MKLNDEMEFRACRVGNMAPRKAGHVPGGFSEGGRPVDVAVGTFRSIPFPPQWSSSSEPKCRNKVGLFNEFRQS